MLPISLGATVLYLSTAEARFLQPINLSIPQITLATSTNVTFTSSLNCGECILGGYTYCVNAKENYTGSVAPQATCCQTFSACSKQAANTSWTCSSKYNDTAKIKYTIFDKLKVCPYNANCGPQDLTLESQNAAQCLRVDTLKKGSSCIYRVQSKCNTANFTLNDTSNVYSTSLLVKNTTILSPTPA